MSYLNIVAEREELGSNHLRICNFNLAPPAETEIQLTAYGLPGSALACSTNWPPGARALVVTTDTLTPNS